VRCGAARRGAAVPLPPRPRASAGGHADGNLTMSPLLGFC